MEQENKLYKCYKPGCNFKADDPDNPFLTQIEYEELIKEGKLICPENFEECGIRELKPEDYPKLKKKLNKKIFVFGGMFVFIVIIIVFIILFSKKQTVNEPVNEDSTRVVTIKNPQVVEEIQKDTLATKEQKNETVTKEEYKAEQTTSKANQSKTFSNGDRYIGEMKNGKMHGLGTYYYNKEQQISEKDIKKRIAKPGDYLSGEWYEGSVVNGKLFDSQNNIKEVVIIGR